MTNCKPIGYYAQSPNYCWDNLYSPFTHPNQVCFRKIVPLYSICSPAEHICFNINANSCYQSPDRCGPATGIKPFEFYSHANDRSFGSHPQYGPQCTFSFPHLAAHTIVDFFDFGN